VNLATGLLMVNAGCTAKQAEGLLQQAATNDGQTILEIAQRIIRHHRMTAGSTGGDDPDGRRSMQ